MAAIILDSQDPPDDRAHLGHLVETDEGVDLGKRLAQFTRKTLRHASAHDQLLARFFPESALLMRIQNRLDRFFLR